MTVDIVQLEALRLWIRGGASEEGIVGAGLVRDQVGREAAAHEVLGVAWDARVADIRRA